MKCYKVLRRSDFKDLRAVRRTSNQALDYYHIRSCAITAKNKMRAAPGALWGRTPLPVTASTGPSGSSASSSSFASAGV